MCVAVAHWDFFNSDLKGEKKCFGFCVICWGHGALCCSHANEAISIEWKGSWTHEPVPACVRFATCRNLSQLSWGMLKLSFQKCVCVCVCVCMCLCVFELLSLCVCVCACVMLNFMDSSHFMCFIREAMAAACWWEGGARQHASRRNCKWTM